MEKIILKNGPLSFSALACGPADGPVVLLLHGFPDNPHTFDVQLRALGDAGYRAIAPTMRGYEPSSQPVDGDYRIGTMARDVLAWSDELGVEKVHLVGHDWGAAVTYVAGALAPERFHSLTTMAVPHLPRTRTAIWKVPIQFRNSWYMSFFQLRGIAEWCLERNDWAMIRWLCARWSPGLSLPEKDWENRRATFEAPGVKEAMLSYYRQNVALGVALGIESSEALSLRVVPVRSLIIMGLEDGCMDMKFFEQTFFEEDFPEGFEIARIEQAGHFMHLDSPDVVTRTLLDWFAKESEGGSLEPSLSDGDVPEG